MVKHENLLFKSVCVGKKSTNKMNRVILIRVNELYLDFQWYKAHGYKTTTIPIMMIVTCIAGLPPSVMAYTETNTLSTIIDDNQID